MLIEPNMIEVNEIDIHDTGTDMKIGFISDFQRRDDNPAFMQRVVDIMNEKDLDVVLIAGDIIQSSLNELPSVEPLKKLKTNHGVYVVFGNHDYGVYSLQKSNPNLDKAEKIADYLQSDGTIQILRNENIKINGISIIGLDSYWAGLRDEKNGFSNTGNEYKILFTHNQEDLEIDKEIADLYLFGHTHCGQVRLPIVGSVTKLLGFVGEYDYKHYVVNGADVYTTCGLAPAPRLLNLPEITILNLFNSNL